MAGPADLLSDLKGLADPSWKGRVLSVISMVSPLGNPFVAQWIGNPRKVEKSIGRFKYPGIKGELIQDLDVGADTYSMNIFFDGSAHDIDAFGFFRATKERGRWTVIHPVHGPLDLFLISVTQVVDPTNAGNISEFNLEWVESIDARFTFSIPTIPAFLLGLVSTINSTVAFLFGKSVNQNNAAFIQAIRNVTNVATVAVNRNLGGVFNQDADVTAFVEATQRAIQETISEEVVDTEDLSGQFQQLIQTAVTGSEDLEDRLDAINATVDALLLTISTEPSIENKNFSATLEMILMANLGAAAQVAVSSPLSSRRESLNAMDLFLSIFEKILNGLDTIQEAFEGNSAEDQYFSMLDSFPETVRMVNVTADFLLTTSFGLAVERRFIITKTRTPLEITVSEYGDLGEDDSNLDLFIDTNKLKGNDILLLPAGREVVVYA